MITFAQLLLPLFVSAVLVFIASSLIHMVFKWHTADYAGLSNEDEVAAVLRKGGARAGQYTLPYCSDMKQMRSAEMQQKLREGPQGFITLRPPGVYSMGKPLLLWLLLSLFVAAVAAAICSAALGPGAARSQVFYIAGLISFAAYATGSLSDGIWFARPWGSVARDLLDAAVYAGITGASFALLWPVAQPLPG